MNMAVAKKPTKKVTKIVKMQIGAGAANPAPPVGTMLGPTGINMMEFCKQFNAATSTSDFEPKQPVPVSITIYADRSFSFTTRTPPATFLIKKAAGVTKGSSKPGTESLGTLSRAHIEKIARLKMPNLTANSLEAAMRSIEGSARSMGLKIEEGN